MKKIFDLVFGNAYNLLSWAGDFLKDDDDTKKKMKERLPGFLGFSLEDERIFAGLRARLEEDEDFYLSQFLSSLKDYECNRFRNVVAGIPLQEKITFFKETDEDKQKKGDGEKHYESLAIPFLKKLAMIVKNYGPEEARKRCLEGGIILENPIHQQALEAWRKSVKWFKRRFLDFFGVDSLKELEEQGLFKSLGIKIDEIAEPWDNWLEERENRHWLKRLFWA